MYSCTLSLTSTLVGDGWSTPRNGCFTPGKDPVPIVQEAGWLPGPVWIGAENPAPHRGSIPGPSSPLRVELYCEIGINSGVLQNRNKIMCYELDFYLLS